MAAVSNPPKLPSSPGRWLLKTEPATWSWDQQVARGSKGEQWDGIRNYQARNHMKAMRKGDLGFFYHSGEERRIVGIVAVLNEAHPDTTDTTGTWQCVDVVALQALAKPVSLEQVKAEPRLENMALVKNSRLSVQPVTLEEWALVCRMGGLDPPKRA